MRFRSFGSLILLLFTSLITLPLAIFLQRVWKKQDIDTSKFFGMSVNLDKEPEQTLSYVRELNIKNLLIRFPMWEIHQIQSYQQWIRQFNDHTIVLNIIQDPTLSKSEQINAFELIFKSFSEYVQYFQIGTTINRGKWGFYSVRTYLVFYQSAFKVARTSYPNIKLLGPSVIDFEYHYNAQAMFNFFPIHYDACSALLYTDRTVTPENKQFGFSLLGKIDFLYSLVRLSPKSDNRIFITETNWPLKDSGKFAPTSQKECVSEEAFANYMVRYYLLALGSRKVEAVYWHQLIAAGFGLIDPRDHLRKRSAFDAFKTMLEQLQGATEIKLIQHRHYFQLNYTMAHDKRSVLWTNDTSFILALASNTACLSRDGKHFKSDQLTLSGQPTYLLSNEHL